MEKGKNNLKFSNRVLYSLVTLGILAIFAVGVYAYGSSNPSSFGHSVGEIEGLCPAGKTLSHRTQSFGTNNPDEEISSFVLVGDGYACDHYGVTDTCDGNINAVSPCPASLSGTCRDYISFTGVYYACHYTDRLCFSDTSEDIVDVVVCQ